MSIRMAFLGTGTCHATARNPSSLAVSNGNEIILVDAGGGAYHQLPRLTDPFFDYRNISTVFLTHFHVDHVSGLPDLIWGEMWGAQKRERPLALVGPKGLKHFYEDRLLPFIGDYTFPFAVTLSELAPDESFHGAFYTACSYHLHHGDCSTGYLFNFPDAALAITGDTGYCENLLTLLRSADIAVMEWSMPAGQSIPDHLSTDDVLRIAKAGAFPQQVYAQHMYLLPDEEFEARVESNRQTLGADARRFIFPKDGDIVDLTPLS